MQIATWLFMVAFAYGIGVFWYDLLPGKITNATWRVAAYPLAVMVIAEAIFPNLGPSFMGFHPITALIAGLVGVVIDWIITAARHPRTAETMELRSAPAAG